MFCVTHTIHISHTQSRVGFIPTHLPYLLQKKPNADLGHFGHWWVGMLVEVLPGDFLPGHVIELICHPLGPGEAMAVVCPETVRETKKPSLVCRQTHNFRRLSLLKVCAILTNCEIDGLVDGIQYTFSHILVVMPHRTAIELKQVLKIFWTQSEIHIIIMCVPVCEEIHTLDWQWCNHKWCPVCGDAPLLWRSHTVGTSPPSEPLLTVRVEREHNWYPIHQYTSWSMILRYLQGPWHICTEKNCHHKHLMASKWYTSHQAHCHSWGISLKQRWRGWEIQSLHRPSWAGLRSPSVGWTQAQSVAPLSSYHSEAPHQSQTLHVNHNLMRWECIKRYYRPFLKSLPTTGPYCSSEYMGIWALFRLQLQTAESSGQHGPPITGVRSPCLQWERLRSERERQRARGSALAIRDLMMACTWRSSAPLGGSSTGHPDASQSVEEQEGAAALAWIANAHNSSSSQHESFMFTSTPDLGFTFSWNAGQE